MARVQVSTPVLYWAIERSGKPDYIEKKFPKLSSWLEGKVQPTLNQLEDFAKATSTPLGFLFLTNPPEDILPVPYFRTINEGSSKRPSADLLETVHTLKRRQAWFREYLIEEGHARLDFVEKFKNSINPKNVAEDIRNTLGLEDGWASSQPNWSKALRSLMDQVEEIGVLVFVNGVVSNNTHRKLNPEEFRGLVLVDDYAPVVFINAADGKAAQMFTLAHELAHVWLGSSAAFDLRELQPSLDNTEQICNQIAAEFLVPTNDFLSSWDEVKKEEDPFQMLASRFKVSELVIARRALDLELISKDHFVEYYYHYREPGQKKPKDQTGGDFYNNQNMRLSNLFTRSVVRAAKEGKLLYREAYQLTALYGKTFDSYANKISEVSVD
jgi:Zn-dependent peptidase ImmA (M78 family)